MAQPGVSSAESSDLQTLIENEARLLDQFLSLLRREQTSLMQGHAEDLPGLSEQKNGLVLQLNGLSASRAAFLEAHALPANRAGIEAWFAQGNDRNAGDAWQRVLALAAEARELNRVNGDLIQTRMQFTANALEALSGAKTSLELYGPDGQSTKPGSRRINDAV